MPFLVIYVVLLPWLPGVAQTSYFVFLLAALLIPLTYLTQTMSYVGGNIKPEYIGYSGLAYELTKLFSSVILVVILGLSLVGAVLTVEIALAMQVLALVILSWKHLHSGFRKKLAKRWVSHSWLSGLMSNSTVLMTFDAALVLVLAAPQLSEPIALETVGYFALALAISQLVSIAGSVAGNLTTKLLKGGQATDVEVMLRLALLLGIPILAGGLLLARSLVYVVAPAYSVIVPIVRVLMLSTFVDIISSMSDSVIQGTTNIDKKEVGFKELAKSRLFLLPSINLLMGASYLVMLYLVLSTALSNSSPSIFELGFLWSIVFLLVKLPFVLYKFGLAKKVAKFRIPYRSIAKYSLGSVVMVFALIYVMYFTPFLVYVSSESARDFIVYPIILIGIGSIIYSTLMLVIDKEFRQLARIVIRSIHLRRREN
jgi:hypothetical protein